MVRHIRGIIVLVVMLAVVALAARAVGARARPAEAAVPVVWMLCDDASAHSASSDEAVRDACWSLFCWAVASCEDDDGDGDED